MKILHVSSARAYGGGEKHLAGLARGLAAKGHEIFLALRSPELFRERLGDISSDHVFTLPLRNAFDLPSGRKLARILRDHKIDIVHAHVARDYPVAALAARRSGSRLALTRHLLFPLQGLHRIALSNVSRVIAVSRAVEKALRDQRIFDPGRIVVVANGVDAERFVPAPEARSGSEISLRVGIVGELSPVKAQEDFLRVAAVVASDFTGNVEFLIVGEDQSPSRAYRARLERLIADLRLGGHARLMGHRGEEEMPAIVGSFDVLVSTSHQEAFGMAMAEAMACGVPVVASGTEGAREIVEDGVTGVITPIGDTKMMAAAVVALLQDPGQRRAFGQRAVLSARRRFSLQRMVDETEKVYEEILREQ
ncbi:MAG TPA: glycosyltransferase family 4 protein [Terriglobia bacterium]|nr:glycosyltransferase family 4 protein [Terriglobia bacterium]